MTSDGIRHWHRVQTKPTPHHYHYYRPHYVQADPIDIEMTSYALLTYAAENDFTGGIPVMKWIMNQRNSWGGFGSTQVKLNLLCLLFGSLSSSKFRDLHYLINLLINGTLRTETYLPFSAMQSRVNTQDS